MAEQSHRAVHALKAGVGQALGDGVDDQLAVEVDGQSAANERIQVARECREDLVIKERRRILVAGGLVHRPQLLDQQPSPVDVVVVALEGIKDRAISGPQVR